MIEEERPGKRRRILVYPFGQPVNYTNPSEIILQLEDNQDNIFLPQVFAVGFQGDTVNDFHFWSHFEFVAQKIQTGPLSSRRSPHHYVI